MLPILIVHLALVATTAVYSTAVPIQSDKPPLNKRELIFLANELTPKECRQLASALREEQFALKSTPTGNDLPIVPCAELLNSWNYGDGKKSSWTHVTHRLYQIGRKDLSENLADTILAEKRYRLNKYVFRESPRKHSNHGGILLDDDWKIKPNEIVKRDVDSERKNVTPDTKTGQNVYSYSASHSENNGGGDKIVLDDDINNPYVEQYMKPASKELVLAVVIPMVVAPGVMLIVVFIGIMLTCRKDNTQQPRQQLHVHCDHGNGARQEEYIEMAVKQTKRSTNSDNHRIKETSGRTKNNNVQKGSAGLVKVHWIDQSEDNYNPYSRSFATKKGSMSEQQLRTDSLNDKDFENAVRRQKRRDRRKAVEREKYSVMIPSSSSEDSEEGKENDEC